MIKPPRHRSPHNPTEEAIACVVEACATIRATASCCTRRSNSAVRSDDELEAERFIGQQPECTQALQEPFTLVRQLVACGGLAHVRHDADGTPLDSTRQAELERIDDDAIAATRNATRRCDHAGRSRNRSAAGPRASHRRPRRHRAQAARRLLRLLEHFREPRSLDSVKQLFDGHPALEPSARSSGQRLHAVYFIDRLDEAGGLVWNDAWVTTEAGERFLATV